MADVWSLGVLYVSMILGDLPWDSATSDDEAFVNAFSPDRGLLLASMPPESRPLVKHMLNINPHQRPSMVEIFADPWIGSIRI
jgi:serine/threonine protein kinase